MQAASGLVVAAVFVLLVLPPLLALFGRRLFWPFIPRVGDKRPHRQRDLAPRRRRRWLGGRARSRSSRSAPSRCCAPDCWRTPIGLSQTEQFRVQAESVSGYDTLAAHFPSGLTDPTRVIASTDRAADVQRAITTTPGVVSATPAGTSPNGLTQWSVVLDAAPGIR